MEENFGQKEDGIRGFPICILAKAHMILFVKDLSLYHVTPLHTQPPPNTTPPICLVKVSGLSGVLCVALKNRVLWVQT